MMVKSERNSPDTLSIYSQKDPNEDDAALEVDELIDRIRYKIQRTLEQKAEHSGRRSK
jgi:hypothetical protein